MKEEKHSDQIFRNKLENYSVDPPEHIWTGVQEQLLRNKKSRRIIYTRWISAAAAILLAFLGGWYFNHNADTTQTITSEKSNIQPTENNRNKETEPELKNVEPVKNKQEFIASAVKKEKTETDINKQTVASLKPEAKVNVTSSENRSRETLNFKELEGREPDFIFNEKRKIKLPQNHQFSTSMNDLTETDRVLIASNTADYKNLKNENKHWKLGMMVSPGYSSQVANHSDGYSTNMIYSTNSGSANVTGGISVQVKTSKRISVESGVYYDKNGQKEEQLFQFFGMAKQNEPIEMSPGDAAFSGNTAVKDSRVALNSNAGVIALDNYAYGLEVSGNMESLVSEAANAYVTSGEVSQVFDFIQIPLYLRYKVVDSRFDVEMIGGFNAGMLVGNNAYINNDFGSQNIGKTKDISPFSVSGTLGVGLNYKLSNHFSIGAEPRFNYFLSSINKNPDVSYKPYRIGFYTGIYYEF